MFRLHGGLELVHRVEALRVVPHLRPCRLAVRGKENPIILPSLTGEMLSEYQYQM